MATEVLAVVVTNIRSLLLLIIQKKKKLKKEKKKIFEFLASDRVS